MVSGTKPPISHCPNLSFPSTEKKKPKVFTKMTNRSPHAHIPPPKNEEKRGMESKEDEQNFGKQRNLRLQPPMRPGVYFCQHQTRISDLWMQSGPKIVKRYNKTFSLQAGFQLKIKLKTTRCVK